MYGIVSLNPGTVMGPSKGAHDMRSSDRVTDRASARAIERSSDRAIERSSDRVEKNKNQNSIIFFLNFREKYFGVAKFITLCIEVILLYN